MVTRRKAKTHKQRIKKIKKSSARKKSKQRKTTKKKIGICHYHLCRKKRELYKCKYCNEYFCKENLNPKPPGLPRFKGTSYEDRIFMEEWHKPGGHPCMPYFYYWEEKNRRKAEEYRTALNKLLERKTPIKIPTEEAKAEQEIIKKIKEKEKIPINKKLVFLTFFVLLLILGISLYYRFSYTPNGLEYNPKEIHQKVYSKIQEYRIKNNLEKLKLNEEISKLNIDINNLKESLLKNKIYYFNKAEVISITFKNQNEIIPLLDKYKDNLLSPEFDQLSIQVHENYINIILIKSLDCGYPGVSCCSDRSITKYDFCFRPFKCHYNECVLDEEWESKRTSLERS